MYHLGVQWLQKASQMTYVQSNRVVFRFITTSVISNPKKRQILQIQSNWTHRSFHSNLTHIFSPRMTSWEECQALEASLVHLYSVPGALCALWPPVPSSRWWVPRSYLCLPVSWALAVSAMERSGGEEGAQCPLAHLFPASLTETVSLFSVTLAPFLFSFSYLHL